jgi:hypothetical protein
MILYNSWKTFWLLYGPSKVNSVFHDAAYDSCGPLWYAPRPNKHPACEPNNQAERGYFVGSITKKWFSCQWNQPFEEDLLLLKLAVIVPTLVESNTPLYNCPMFCRTLWTTELSLSGHTFAASNVKLHFEFFFTAFLWCFQGGGCMAEFCIYVGAAFSGRSVIVAGCA